MYTKIMKSYSARADLGEGVSVEAAADIAFGEPVLKKVHGPSLRIEAWDAQESRTLSFAKGLEGVPRLLRGLVTGEGRQVGSSDREVRVLVRQALARPRPETIECHSVVNMQCRGARFVKIRPQFEISKLPGEECVFEARVQVHAHLPFGLAGLAETFMLRSARRELDVYVSAVREATININNAINVGKEKRTTTAGRIPGRFFHLHLHPHPHPHPHPLLSPSPMLPAHPVAFPVASPTAVPAAFRISK